MKMNKVMKRVMAYFAINYTTLGFAALVQGLVRMVLKPDFIFPMVQFYSVIFCIILVIYFVDKWEKIRIWKENQKKPMSDRLKHNLAVCEIKLEFDCSIEEAEKKYWDRYWDSKFDPSQYKIRFRAITREVNYEDIPNDVKRKLEKAA